jgi:predicted aspartyl protease
MVHTPCSITATSNLDTSKPPTAENLVALWDTGATLSGISNRVAQQLGLQSVGRVMVDLADGASVVRSHIVDIELPKGTRFRNLTVLECDLAPEDVLIGMDIIAQGDFALSAAGGRTTFSFRKPPVSEIDFVQME